MKKTLALSLLLCAIALPLRSHAHHMLNRYDWHPISYPIRLVSNQAFETSFIADQSSEFNLVLSTTRSPHPEQYIQQRCRINIEFSAERCEEVPVELDLMWAIRSNNQVLATGEFPAESPGGQFYNGRGGKPLTTFPTKEAERYTISLQINHGDEFLNALDPHLDVQIGGLQYTEVYKQSKLYEYAATLLLVIGVLIGIFGTMRTFLDRQT